MSTQFRSGFTLVEIIVTIGILTTLSLLVFSTISGVTERAGLARLVSHVNDIKRTALTYRSDNGTWPPTYLPEENSINPFVHTPVFPLPTAANWKGPYIQKYPDNHPWGGNIGFVNDTAGCVAIVIYDNELGSSNNSTAVVPVKIRSMLDNRYDSGSGRSAGKVQWNEDGSSVTMCGKQLGINEIGIRITE